MKRTNFIAASVMAAALSTTALAGSGQSDNMPMQQGQMMQDGQMPMQKGQMKGGMMHGGGMGMMNPEMMKQKQAMMQKHMATMEQHMANIESLLKELVELQKQK